MQSYEIMSGKFSWEILHSEDLYGCSVTHSVRLSDGTVHIIKN